MGSDLWSQLAEHRERLVCALAAVLFALTLVATVRDWRAVEPLGPPGSVLQPPRPLPKAPFLRGPFAQVWAAEGSDPFQPPGRQVVARGATELPFPPLPPVSPIEPPPADPWPSLYRSGVARSQAHLLTLAAEPQPPKLKSGRPCTITPRPHDIVQAKGDAKPIEGTVRREDKATGRVWFYYNKPRGYGHPKNPLVVADLLVYKRQTRTVREAYQERSREAGPSAPAHVALAVECLDGDLVAEAQAELRRAIELDPKHLAAYLKLADLAVVQGHADAEIGAVEAALAAGADAPELRERVGRRCVEHGLFALAYGHFASGFQAAAGGSPDAVVAKQLPLPKAPLARRLLRQAAEVRAMQGRLHEARRMLEPLAEATPDDPAVRNAQALVDLLAGRAQQALTTLRQVAAAPTPPASALNALGAVLFSQAHYDQALARFDACRAAAPSHAKAAANAALAAAALGQLEQAEKQLAAIAHPPAGSLPHQLVVGYVRERRGRLDEAIAAYQGARQVDPACYDALCGLGRCLLAKGDHGLAAEPFGRARLVRPDGPCALRGVGTCLYRAGKLAEAADAFEPLAGRQGAPPRDLARLGLACLRLQDRRRDAVALLDKALADPAATDPYALAGRAYLAYDRVAGTQQQAEALFRKAQAATDAPEARRYAAEALRRIFVARREEFATLTFQGDGTAKLPEGWHSLGRGIPLPAIRGNALRLDGKAPAATLREVVRREPLAAPAEKGVVRTFARFEAQVHVPPTNQAAVGISLGVGDARFQVAVRTTLKPRPDRRLAWRILRGDQPSPWVELQGSVAADRLKLGLGLSERGERHVAILRQGKIVAPRLEFAELAGRPDAVDLGLFAAPEAGQECLFSVRQVELVWKKAAAPDR